MKLIAIVLLIFLSVNLHSIPKEDFTRLSETEKQYYILGFMHGNQMTIDLILSNIFESKEIPLLILLSEMRFVFDFETVYLFTEAYYSDDSYYPYPVEMLLMRLNLRLNKYLIEKGGFDATKKTWGKTYNKVPYKQ